MSELISVNILLYKSKSESYVVTMSEPVSEDSIEKCALCNIDLSCNECAFSTVKKVIDGKEYSFCCERHSKQFRK
jgi:hypothetical protein